MLVMGLALVDGGQLAKVYLLGDPLTPEIIAEPRLPGGAHAADVPEPAAVAGLVACAGAGALARRSR
jgi:hypothetical protein